MGSPKPQAVIGGVECRFHPCMVMMTKLPGATLFAPADGVIVRWRFFDGTPGHQYKLRILKPLGGLTFQAAGTSAAVTASGYGLETFPAAIPIEAGEQVAIELDTGATVATTPVSGAEEAVFPDPIADGMTGAPTELFEREVGLNVDIQPAPSIAFVSPPSGPLEGGNLVEISGSDFSDASAVRFGDSPAKSYRVDSDGLITAIAPPTDAPAAVPISVTTLAGTATTQPEYEYRVKTDENGPGQPPTGKGRGPSCRVPELKGKKLKAAKKQLRRARCRAGKVRRAQGASIKAGRVVEQWPGAGKTLPPGARVSVTLASAPADRSA